MLKLSPHIASKLQRIEVLVLACSAGGFKVLLNMLQVLPENLSIGVLVIIHRNAKYETNIETSLSDKCRIVVKMAEEKEYVKPATAYFAPAGYHLLMEPDHSMSLDVSEPVNFCRPSIDVTMQSVSDVYGASTAAILLSGANQDGAKGMQSIHQAGGLCIAQHPEQAEIATMPASAIALGVVDVILKNDELLTFSRQLNNYILRRD
ncbi:chemotaxis protein CheB [Parapedobacter pyrenivorans]|uniref:protein-glutamate methylesterase n=1 Tax=Parapedobacter pyrenivorans TaxID=1305674 RepID=A0A917MB63_9SPHI|nr:chemotaxis protein CheB [Parapedobacter pyrenivorans]GGG86613.1 chemotaxis protein CheB [Parapedobacter pyrenivorans]